jgi:hypothetical protein
MSQKLVPLYMQGVGKTTAGQQPDEGLVMVRRFQALTDLYFIGPGESGA